MFTGAKARLDPAGIPDACPDALLIVDRAEQVLFANPAAHRMFLCDAGGLVGRALAELVPTWARGRHTHQVEGFFEKPRPRPFGTQHRLAVLRGDGSELPVDIALAHTMLEEQPVVIASLRDRSAQRDAERARDAALAATAGLGEKLAAILSAMPGFVVEVDRQGLVRFINRTRWLPQERVLGLSWLQTVPEAERPRLQAVLDEVFQTGETREYEVELTDPDGTRRWFSSRAGPILLRSAEGQEQVVGAVITSQDVSAQRRLQAELDAAQRLAAVGMLAAGVAHEINNPLAAAITNLSLAQKTLEQPCPSDQDLIELREELQDALHACQRIRAVASDLKVLARPKDELSSAVDTRAVFEGMLRLANNEIRHRARVVRDYQPVPAVSAAEGRLGQVLLNLLVNAAQALPDGRAELHEIRVSTRMAADGLVCLEVSDTGPGMSDEVRQRLFTPFFTTKSSGTGLGLALCDKIVRGFGGRMEVESQVGAGSTFRVLLAPAAPARADTPAITAPRTSPTQRRGRLLVVDDDPAVRTAIQRGLSVSHEVRTSAGARDAMALLEGGDCFDVIVCDVMMPEQSGPELIAGMLKRWPALVDKILIVTGGAFTKHAGEFLERTRHPVIEKPFDPAQLMRAVNALLRPAT